MNSDTSQQNIPDDAPQSFQDYLTTVVKAELLNQSKGVRNRSPSRQRRSKIKLIIKKILLFFIKYFLIVAKKTAIIVG